MLNDTPSQDIPVAQLRVMQIITTAMLAGIVLFLGVVLVLHQLGHFAEPALQPSLLSLIAAIQFILIFAAWLFLPGIILRQGVYRMARQVANPTGQIGRLLALKQTTSIIACALMEFGAYLALIAYLMERQHYTLGIALACLLMIVVTFPTHNRLNRWLTDQQDRIDMLRRSA